MFKINENVMELEVNVLHTTTNPCELNLSVILSNLTLSEELNHALRCANGQSL